MDGDGRQTDRRRFLQALGTTVLAAAGCNSSCGSSLRGRERSPGAFGASTATSVPLAAKPRVVVVKAKKALTQGYDADSSVLRAMLEVGLCALTGLGTASAALSRYLRPGERVGLKVNGLAGRNAATHVELVDALSVLLGQADIDGHHQIAFDRFASDLTVSGFVARAQGYRCVGNDQAGHEDELVQMPSSASRLARVLTSHVDGLVNLPVLKQHMLAGMTGALKNNFGCIHNPNKMHLDHCDPYIAEVNAVPQIRDKQRLVIMDALRPVVDNGPSYQPGMAEPANMILFATDLVAVDTVGWGVLEGLRAKRALPSLAKVGLTPSYLATASKMGLGVSDRAAIEVVTIEV